METLDRPTRITWKDQLSILERLNLQDRGRNTPSRATPGDVGTSEGTLIVCDIVVDEHANDSASSKNDLISVPIENGVTSSKEDSDSGIDGSISDFEKKDKNEEKENLESNEGPIDEMKNLKLDRPDRPKKKLTMPKRKKTTSKDSESDATTSQRSEGLHVDTTATALTKDLHSPTSPQPRLFRIQVKDQIFTVDSEYMKELSPIFLTMFYGKDFDKNRELMRVIVDETPNDIRMMLDIIKGSRQIGVKNFALLLRLARKYQITSLLEDCENYVRDLELEKMMGDDILTLLVDSYEYQCSRDVVSQLIVRLAKEGNAQFARLKISRYLNAQIYGSVISTSMNFSAIKEMETMNGHQLTMAGSHTKWEFGYCSKCTTMKSESCMCIGCHTSLCRSHVQMNSCEKEYGIKRIEQLKEEIANPTWTY